MLRIRLSRIGKKNEPHYRIVVIPQRTKRDGRAVEHIGYYNPIKKTIKLDTERAKYWLSVGAMPTDTVRGIFVKQKILKAKPREEMPARKPKKEAKEEKSETQVPKTTPKKEEVKKEAEKKEEKPKKEVETEKKEEKKATAKKEKQSK